MKRLVTTLLLAGSGLAAMAQAPFSIFRPENGAKVRETVHVRIPKNSVPPDGYIGIFIGGKFVEATLPPLDKTGKFYEYDLDTKARAIPDGQLTLEAVLYVDYADKPRIVNRTSVEVTVANTADNTIPESGLKLQYKWSPGTEMIYDYSSREIRAEGDTEANKLGIAKPDTTSLPLAHYRILYACDNAYPDGSGLVRMQALPLKGKDSIMTTTITNPDQPQRFTQDQFFPIYEHLKSDGLELWGSIPFNLPMDGTAGAGPSEILFVDDPLPTLPDKPIHVGNSWASRFQDGRVPPPDTASWYLLGSVVEHYPARGEFKGIEWEMGHPCAKIVNTITFAEASEEATKLAKSGSAFTGNKISLTETMWFALDRRQIVKIVRQETADAQVPVENGFGGAGSGNPTEGSPGGKGAGAIPPSDFAANGGNQHLPPPPSSDYQVSAGGTAGATPQGGGTGNLSSAGGGLGRQGGRSGAPNRTKFVRSTREDTYILEL